MKSRLYKKIMKKLSKEKLLRECAELAYRTARKSKGKLKKYVKNKLNRE